MEKVWLGVDMLRYGPKSLGTTGERVVLPRPWDLAISVVDLRGIAKLRAWDSAVEVLILDFTDAFLTLNFSLNFESVAVGIPEKRTLETTEVADNLKNKKGRRKIDEGRSFVGLASWVSGIIPRLRPFAAHLWSAMHDSARRTTTRSATRQRPKNLPFARRI